MKGRAAAAIVFCLAILGVLVFIAVHDGSETMDFSIVKYNAQQMCEPCYKIVRQLYISLLVKTKVQSWDFYILVTVILLCERARPVYTRLQASWVSFFHDVLWFFVDALFAGILIPVYQGLLLRIYDSHFTFFRVDVINEWPIAGQILLAVLMSDFIRWFHHFLRHKIPLFWYFHTIHHSQRDMNLFTDSRVHPVERFIEAGVAFIPFLSLRTDVAIASLAGWNLFGIWYARFYHSNIKSSLGILRYIMVTPQSHRVHHSRMQEHQDKNFGAIFSIWDHLFRTQYRGYDEYPETGLEEREAPQETELGWHRTIGVLLHQLVYPFQRAFSCANEITTKRAAT